MMEKIASSCRVRLLPAVLLLFLFLVLAFRRPPERVLIIQDERPQTEVLADFLEERGGLEVEVVEQDGLPEDLTPYRAVLLFIHGDLHEATERAAIDYTRRGGRLIPLHHSISSGKAENPHYFDFLGIRLDHPMQSSKAVEPGEGYGWRHTETDGEGVTLTLVNLNPSHYITSHRVDWGEPIRYIPSDGPSAEGYHPSLSLEDSEVYLNHKFTDGREKVVLMGLKYYDDRVDYLFMQDRAGWIKAAGEGEIIYLMPGHAVSDYAHPAVAQMILNAITWQE